MQLFPKNVCSWWVSATERFLPALHCVRYGLPFWAVVSAIAGAAEQVDVPQVVFAAGENGYHTYRIPVLIRAANGDLLAFCEGRKLSRSDDGDIDLLMKRSADGGATWSEHAIVHEEGGDAPITIGNPCPVLDETTGTLWLAFTRNNERAFAMSSKDSGVSWSPPGEITSMLATSDFAWKRIGTGPVNGIQTEGGRLVLPVWLNDRKGEEYRAAALFSDDYGKRWHLSGIIANNVPDSNECTVAPTSDGRLIMSMRNKHEAKRRAITYSDDGGSTWSAPYLCDTLFSSQCQGSLIALESDDSILHSHIASTARELLTLSASHDDGLNWKKLHVIWEGPAAYSSLVSIDPEFIGCLFESGIEGPYEAVRFVRMGHDNALGLSDE